MVFLASVLTVVLIMETLRSEQGAHLNHLEMQDNMVFRHHGYYVTEG